MKKWIRFLNINDNALPKHGGVCAKHFEERYLKIGERITLNWALNPVPSVYTNTEFIPPSVLPLLQLHVSPQQEGILLQMKLIVSRFKMKFIIHQTLRTIFVQKDIFFIYFIMRLLSSNWVMGKIELYWFQRLFQFKMICM